jgi:hypothetical protein
MSKNIVITKEQFEKIINNAPSLNEQEMSEGSDGNYMTKQHLFTIATLSYKMWEMLEEGQEIEDWMESKIAQCESSIVSVIKAFVYNENIDDIKGMDKLNYEDLVIGR